ncbi:MAG TPA: DLW-39 family protein [Dermatophilaceae bacterium]
MTCHDLHDELPEGVSVMKKILLLVAAVAGVLAIQKKFKAQQAEQDLWAEATDKV